MNSVLLISLTVIFSVIVAKLILKKYNAIFVFFTSGIVIMLIANALTGTPILGKATLGSPLLDVRHRYDYHECNWLCCLYEAYSGIY